MVETVDPTAKELDIFVIEKEMKMEVCEICGSEMKPIYPTMSRKEKTLFLMCTQCKLRWAPLLEVDRSFTSRLNEESRQKALSEVRKNEFEQVNQLILRHVKEGARGLEIGCAYGWFLDSVGSRYRMEGIEPEDTIAEQARRKGHKVITGFFPNAMKESAEKYDFMVFNNVWEHINHTTLLIEGSLKYLVMGGVMFITVPLSTGGLYRIAECFEKLGNPKWLARLWQLHFHSPHIYYFTKRNFEAVMRKYGCELVAIEDANNSIDPRKMKDRFEMDKDERHGGFKAFVFRLVYPIVRRLPADKAIFVFKYNPKL